MRDVLLITPDINVYVSGAIISHGPSSQILGLWRARDLDIAVSPPILDRMSQVFNYPKVRKLTRWSDEDVQDFLADIRASAVISQGILQVEVTTDPEDNTIFACAAEAGAAYIVSGDKKHVLSIAEYRGIRTVTPSAFLELLNHSEQAA